MEHDDDGQGEDNGNGDEKKFNFTYRVANFCTALPIFVCISLLHLLYVLHV